MKTEYLYKDSKEKETFQQLLLSAEGMNLSSSIEKIQKDDEELQTCKPFQLTNHTQVMKIYQKNMKDLELQEKLKKMEQEKGIKPTPLVSESGKVFPLIMKKKYPIEN